MQFSVYGVFVLLQTHVYVFVCSFNNFVTLLRVESNLVEV